MSLAVKHLLIGRTVGAPLEPPAVQDEQCLGASRHRQDLVNPWWKPWKEQRFTSILAYDHLEETKGHTNLEAEPCTANRDLHNRPGKEDQENEIDVQELVLLGSTDEVELPRTSANYDFGPPRACCPGLALGHRRAGRQRR